MIAAGLFFLVIIIVVGVLISAVFLRAAVWLANKIFQSTPIPTQPSLNLPADFLGEDPPTVGNPSASPVGFSSLNNPADNKPSDNNPYAAPQNYGRPAKAKSARTLAIPEPNYGKACGIVLLHSLIVFVSNILLSLSPVEELLIGICSLVVGFLIAMLIYGALLPTTPGRAAVVYLFQVLLTLVISAGFALLIFGVLAVTG